MSLGRITEASITAVREQAHIDKVVASYVTLKRTGNTYKGLCPFHDEKSPSFYVTPERNMFNCFGCGEGGDVIAFIQKIEGLGFIETLERLAEQHGIELVREDTDGNATVPTDEHKKARAHRQRLIEANKAAAAFYHQNLFTPEAEPARQFLTERNFTRDDATTFGCGYSPQGWDNLIKHLTGHGFTNAEIADSGLGSPRKDGTGLLDRFRGRLMWPIHSQTGDIIGFGARKLDPNDTGPKYLNTPETPIYKKSQVLYGLNRARRDIAKNRRVVVVEGYTDVMACHLAGETTAVATCGTAFGEDHIRIIRRLIDDQIGGGEVIYTFDGDAAGQKAALRAFSMDSHFQTHTSVAIEPSGKDPCEVRIEQGNAGVHALLANRVPLFEFALTSTLATFDLTTPDGRINAIPAAAAIIGDIHDINLRDAYAKRASGILQVPISTITKALTQPTSTPSASSTPDSPGTTTSEPSNPGNPDNPASTIPYPDPTYDPNARDAFKVMVHAPKFIQLATTEITRNDFAHPAHKAAWDLIHNTYEQHPPHDSATWVHTVLAQTSDPVLRRFITEIATDQYRTTNGITHETATKTFLIVARNACERRADSLERAVSDPQATTEQHGKAFERLFKNLERLTHLQERLAIIESRHM